MEKLLDEESTSRQFKWRCHEYPVGHAPFMVCSLGTMNVLKPLRLLPCRVGSLVMEVVGPGVGGRFLRTHLGRLGCLRKNAVNLEVVARLRVVC